MRYENEEQLKAFYDKMSKLLGYEDHDEFTTFVSKNLTNGIGAIMERCKEKTVELAEKGEINKEQLLEVRQYVISEILMSMIEGVAHFAKMEGIPLADLLYSIGEIWEAEENGPAVYVSPEELKEHLGFSDDDDDEDVTEMPDPFKKKKNRVLN